MRHLYEYDDEEIESLVNDLGDVGLHDIKGFYLTIIQEGYFAGIIFIVKNYTELYKFCVKTFPSVSSLIEIKPDGKYGIKGMGRAYENPLMAFMVASGDITYEQIYSGLIPRKKLKSLSYYFPATNPYATTEILDKYFTNSKSIIDTPGSRGDLEMESSLKEL